jgi:hypothetical protein
MVPSHGAAANEPDAPADAANDGAATGGQCPVMLGHIGAMNDVCADFTALTDATRRRSLGRMVARFRKPLSELVTVTRSPKYAAAFALLADEDAPMKPGLAAIELAQVFAKNNEGFRAKVAHALNDLAAMTAAARRAKSEGAAEGEETEESAPDEG